MNKDFFLRYVVRPNTVEDWCWFVGILLIGIVLTPLLSRLLTKLFCRIIRKDAGQGVGHADLFRLVRRPWNFFVILIAFYIACQQLSWPPEWKMASPDKFGVRMTLERVLEIAIIVSFTGILLRLADFFGLLLKQRAQKTPGQEDDQLIPFLREAIKVMIVILSFFFTLGAVFHLNVASLIAGLGIGGIAVALAAKESLENLIGSFAIFLDKPFTIGDVIQVNSMSGSIERIGFRSTRIRMEDRSLMIIPNRKMVENETINLTKRNARRVISRIPLAVNTTPEQIEKICAAIQKILDDRKDIAPNETRVNFYEFSLASLDLQVLYFIPDLDFDAFVKIKQEINFTILDTIHKNGATLIAAPAFIQDKK